MTTLETRISVNRLHPLFVAEVTGIDLTVPVPREDFRTIWSLRGQSIRRSCQRVAGSVVFPQE